MMVGSSQKAFSPMLISLVSIVMKENKEDLESYFKYSFVEEEFAMTELAMLPPILLYFLSHVPPCSG